MNNQRELNKRQISLLVTSYNSWKKMDESKMLCDEFEQDDLDFEFWGLALLRLYASVVVSRHRPEEKINVGKVNINHEELTKEMWNIAVTMTNDLGIGGEIEDHRVIEPFLRKADEEVQMPEKNHETQNYLFKLASYCRDKGR